MERITHLIVSLATLMLALSLGGANSPPANPTFVVAASEAADMDLAGWARDRFEAAGLDLPAVVITFHDDRSPCRGNAGLYHPSDPVEVHLCLPQDRSATTAKLTALHELGHAWAESQTTEETRALFLAVRGLDAWKDPARPAHLWGAEHAAETISWALMDTRIRIVRIDDADEDALADAYQVLTGSDPRPAEI